MYKKFYGFKEKPFQIVPNPAYLYLNSRYQNALTFMEYGLLENVGIILLTGEVGTGKTTLIRYILNQYCTDKEVAVIFNTNVTAAELLSLILQSFKLNVDDDNKTKNLDLLKSFLIEKNKENRQVLLIVDEAQNLSRDALEEVRLLSNIDRDESLLLSIMLVAQPEIKARFNDQRLSSFKQRIAVNCQLTALSREETDEYIAFRLQKAGGQPNLFEAEAVAMTYQCSGGIPRSINLICDAALVYGYGYELKTIGISVIEQVIEDKGDMGLATTAEAELQAPATGASMGHDDDIQQRFETLETAIRKLQLQMEWQITELERKSESFKDDLVFKMKELLQTERERSDRVLIEYTRLQEKLETLQKSHNEIKRFGRIRTDPMANTQHLIKGKKRTSLSA